MSPKGTKIDRRDSENDISHKSSARSKTNSKGDYSRQEKVDEIGELCKKIAQDLRSCPIFDLEYLSEKDRKISIDIFENVLKILKISKKYNIEADFLRYFTQANIRELLRVVSNVRKYKKIDTPNDNDKENSLEDVNNLILNTKQKKRIISEEMKASKKRIYRANKHELLKPDLPPNHEENRTTPNLVVRVSRDHRDLFNEIAKKFPSKRAALEYLIELGAQEAEAETTYEQP
tara:strand:- start:223 stop:921 length:699 start_codon:yes stop_codon:yes gene_type:complete